LRYSQLLLIVDNFSCLHYLKFVDVFCFSIIMVFIFPFFSFFLIHFFSLFLFFLNIFFSEKNVFVYIINVINYASVLILGILDLSVCFDCLVVSNPSEEALTYEPGRQVCRACVASVARHVAREA